jgi:hypothetical protein
MRSKFYHKNYFVIKVILIADIRFFNDNENKVYSKIICEKLCRQNYYNLNFK